MIGTGDLSELALGWATYNGDQMSMYGLNASVPKTLVLHLVRYEADRIGGRTGAILHDVCDTPVSPELLPAQTAGRSRRRPRNWSDPTSCTTSSSTTSCARASAREDPPHRRGGVPWPLRPHDDPRMDARVLPPLLRAAVQSARPCPTTVEGGLGVALAARRLAHALRRVGHGLDRRNRPARRLRGPAAAGCRAGRIQKPKNERR